MAASLKFEDFVFHNRLNTTFRGEYLDGSNWCMGEPVTLIDAQSGKTLDAQIVYTYASSPDGCGDRMSRYDAAVWALAEKYWHVLASGHVLRGRPAEANIAHEIIAQMDKYYGRGWNDFSVVFFDLEVHKHKDDWYQSVEQQHKLMEELDELVLRLDLCARFQNMWGLRLENSIRAMQEEGDR